MFKSKQSFFSRRPSLVAIYLGGLVAFLLVSVASTSSQVVASTSSQPMSIANAEYPGGQGTVTQVGGRAFSLPALGITDEQHKAFTVGNSIFRTNWVQAPASVTTLQGLGPLFNTRSCGSCHQQDGRGSPPRSERDEFVGLLLRISVPDAKDPLRMIDVPGYGDQIQSQSILGVPAEGTPRVSYKEITGKFSDGETFTLLSPTYTIENLAYGDLPKNLRISPRLAQQLVGLGLLDTIPEAALLANADPEDRDSNGISGRPNWLGPNGTAPLGRFGWKANKPSVLEQDAAALLGDMGITTPLHKNQECREGQVACQKAFSLKDTEMSMQDLLRLTAYMKLLGVPKRRGFLDPEVLQGEKVFHQIQCNQCHTPSFKTGVDPEFSVLSNQWIFPYTDLLLHDMGQGLADDRPDHQASGREWRTAPLWGIGLVHDVSRHDRLLHDGRARGVKEAILWHDGEAKSAKEEFIKLPKKDREALIKFVNSL